MVSKQLKCGICNLHFTPHNKQETPDNNILCVQAHNHRELLKRSQ